MATNSLAQNELVHTITWYIQLRWIAVAGVMVTVFITSRVLNIVNHPGPLYIIALLIAGYNLAFMGIFRKIHISSKSSGVSKTVTFFANTQITLDLMALTLLLHYSGGIENPFIFYFTFHIVMASILLTARAVYLQATLATFALGLTVYLEYVGTIPHITLSRFTQPGLYQQPIYVFGVSFVFISTLFICTTMATSITRKLRNGEKELVQLKENLEITNAQLQKLDRLKTEYVLKVTHELRSPLSTIESCLKVISQGYISSRDEKKRKEMIDRAERRTEALLDLVNDLLDLSQIKASGSGHPTELMNICSIVQHLADFLKTRIEAKEIQLAVTLPCGQKDINEKACLSTPCGMALIRSNKYNMDHLFSNLISNAIKYTTKEGKVTISIKDRGGNIELWVSDTGIGIPQTDLPNIFNEFYRGTNAKAHAFKGTGLGLSIVKRIVQIQGGKIGIESDVGKGTTVNVLLPKENMPSLES